jgi:hypothetical protein
MASPRDDFIGGVLLALFGAVLLFLASVSLTSGTSELWATRAQFFSTYFVGLTLYAVWRYTVQTGRMVDAIRDQIDIARQQVAAVNKQALAAAEQLSFQRTQYFQANKPVVLLDTDADSVDGGVVLCTVTNVGPGLAVNVYVLRACQLLSDYF